MLKESFKQFFKRTVLDEASATNMATLIAKMKKQLERDDQAIKALMKLYERQRDVEKAAKQTRYSFVVQKLSQEFFRLYHSRKFYICQQDIYLISGNHLPDDEK